MSGLPERLDAPCRECPWRLVAAPGWLGPHSAEEWVGIAHGEAAIACHITIPEGRGGDWGQPGIHQCAGAASYRANVGKLPRDGSVAYGPRSEAVFASPAAFTAHHRRGPA